MKVIFSQKTKIFYFRTRFFYSCPKFSFYNEYGDTKKHFSGGIIMSEEVRIPYRKAKTWHIALSQMTGIMQMAFYVLLGYAAYIGNLGFAIATGLVGVLITLSRVFDSITDPIIAFIIEKFNSKHGKLRIFLFIGWFLMAVSTTLMCNVFAGNFSFGADEMFSNPAGVAVFILIYALYIIGYTFSSCTCNMTGNIMTNDPKQRPTLGVWSTVYSYLSPMIISMVIVTFLLPKFGIPVLLDNGTTDYNFTMPVFQYANIIVCGVSFIALVLACIGLTPYDKPENFKGISKSNKVSFKDMGSLLKGNRELRRYIVAACSDKLAQTVGSQSVISVMLFSIILGSMIGSSIVSVVAMLPSIAFAIIGAKGDLIKEMQIENKYIDEHPDEVIVVAENGFEQFPQAHITELEDQLLDCFPDFSLRMKRTIGKRRIRFAVDIHSIFDIAWCTFARYLAEEPIREKEQKTGKPRRDDMGVANCLHCGKFIYRRNNRQEYCDNPECQKARNANNQKMFRDRKRAEKAAGK